MSSDVEFDRWKSRMKVSLPYSVYAAYTGELRQMYRTMISSREYVYTSLNIDKGAKWEDSPNKFFTFKGEIKKTNAFFVNLKDWSGAYNRLENWTNLNTLVALSASFETYLFMIITLALESDIGVKYGMTKEIDGIKAVKVGAKLEFTSEVVSCTKGEWSSRISNMRSLFHKVPDVLEQNVSTLDKIRKIRNNVAHSFGRDIEKAHEVHIMQKIDSEKLSRSRLLKYWDIIDDCVREIDKVMLEDHIGEYQILCFYHDVEKELVSEIHPNELNTANKARLFRKKYGK